MKLPNALLHFDPALQREPTILEGLEELRAREVPMALFQKISRLRRVLLPVYEDFLEARAALVRRHAPEGQGSISPADAGHPQFWSEYQELLALPFEVKDALALTPEDLKAFPTVPGAALVKIGPLFVDEPESSAEVE